MATFSINDENNISVWENAEQAAKAADSTPAIFHSQAELTRISADWPLPGLWTSGTAFPGRRRFTDSATEGSGADLASHTTVGC